MIRHTMSFEAAADPDNSELILIKTSMKITKKYCQPIDNFNTSVTCSCFVMAE